MRAARKRARAAADAEVHTPTDSDKFVSKHRLLTEWVDGEMTMKDVTELAHYITRAGGQGHTPSNLGVAMCGSSETLWRYQRILRNPLR